MIEATDFANVPARKITQAELQMLLAEGWEPLTELGSPKYRPEWTDWHAAREFIQNSLDETGSYELIVTKDGYSIIADQGKGIGLSAFLLGGGTKAEDPKKIACQRGRFGEGMKLAFLPMLRQGKRVFIRTAGKDVFPVVIEKSALGESLGENIVVLARRNNIASGTFVALESVDVSQYRDRFVDGIPKDAVLVQALGGEPDACTRRHVIHPAPGERGRVYVRDIFVQVHEAAVWTYNFWFPTSGTGLDPNRDKFNMHSAGGNLGIEFQYLLAAMTEAQVVTFLDAIKGQSQHRGTLDWTGVSASGTYPDDWGRPLAEKVFKACAAIMGTDKFTWADGPAENRRLEHNGYRDAFPILPAGLLIPLYKYGFVPMVSDIDKSIGVDAVEVKPKEIARYLPPEMLKSLMQLDKATKELGNWMANALGRDHPAGIFLYVGDPAKASSKLVDDAGFYDPATGRVGISLKTVADNTVLGTLLHEVAHHTSSAPDETTRFEEHLERIGVALVNNMTVAKHLGGDVRSRVVKIQEASQALRYDPDTGERVQESIHDTIATIYAGFFGSKV